MKRLFLLLIVIVMLSACSTAQERECFIDGASQCAKVSSDQRDECFKTELKSCVNGLTILQGLI